MCAYPRWAEHLGLVDVPIVGIDCGLHDKPEVYRRVVALLKQDQHSLGGLVTTHEIDLLKAARDMFDELGEVSSISKRNGRLRGHARDPITSGLSMEASLPADHWRRTAAAGAEFDKLNEIAAKAR